MWAHNGLEGDRVRLKHSQVSIVGPPCGVASNSKSWLGSSCDTGGCTRESYRPMWFGGKKRQEFDDLGMCPSLCTHICIQTDIYTHTHILDTYIHN